MKKEEKWNIFFFFFFAQANFSQKTEATQIKNTSGLGEQKGKGKGEGEGEGEEKGVKMFLGP